MTSSALADLKLKLKLLWSSLSTPTTTLTLLGCFSAPCDLSCARYRACHHRSSSWFNIVMTTSSPTSADLKKLLKSQGKYFNISKSCTLRLLAASDDDSSGYLKSLLTSCVFNILDSPQWYSGQLLRFYSFRIFNTKDFSLKIFLMNSVWNIFQKVEQ